MRKLLPAAPSHWPLGQAKGASILIQDEPPAMGYDGSEDYPAALLSLHGNSTNLILKSVLALRRWTPCTAPYNAPLGAWRAAYPVGAATDLRDSSSLSASF